MKRVLKKIAIVFVVLVALIAIALDILYAYSRNYKIPEQADRIQNETGLVQAHGRSLYDADGWQLQLRGINAGQLLLQEGWMSPFALEPLRNEDGSYQKDADGNLLYPEFTESEFRNALANNPNLEAYDIDSLLATYRNCFFTQEDFRIIKEVLDMNTIRLPFYYLEILNEDLTLKPEDEAFAYLDWFIASAAEQELYIVLDLHGAPGSQNGYEHSGSAGEAGLWDSEENVNATVALWEFVARHYMDTKPELGKWIATYDLLNEPTYPARSTTNETCWNVFDRIYDAIRATGDRHVITVEGCWDFRTLPDPADYGWENVQYEYHWYNWWSDILPYQLFYVYHDTCNIGRDYDVPVFIGEFTLFESRTDWLRQLGRFDNRNYSWTIWNYKTTVTGWWTSSWGVYTCQLNCDTAAEETKCNVATCTYEEFLAACEKTRTENCATGTLYDVLIENQKYS